MSKTNEISCFEPQIRLNWVTYFWIKWNLLWLHANRGPLECLDPENPSYIPNPLLTTSQICLLSMKYVNSLPILLTVSWRYILVLSLLTYMLYEQWRENKRAAIKLKCENELLLVFLRWCRQISIFKWLKIPLENKN